MVDKGNGGPAPYPTLVRPPPEDPSRAPIENVLDVTELAVLGPDIFTNTRPPWHPPGARGIFGGAVIAMCLAAGQRTVAPEFLVHSCHCYFLLAGSGEIPILLHVERVRDGRSFATRTVQARQRGRCIFTTTISFVRHEGGDGRGAAADGKGSSETGNKKNKQQSVVRHAAAFPTDCPPHPPYDQGGSWGEEDTPEFARQGPFQSGPIAFVNRDSAHVHERRTRQWTRARGRISERGGAAAHLCALAYMSDSYFMGTVPRIHKLWRFPVRPDEVDSLEPEIANHIKTLHKFEGGDADLGSYTNRPSVGMMVSLDHTIYFHEPSRVRADDWMLSEMESPWSGDGRGVVTQRIFSKDGTLLATCFQEGLVRLKPIEEEEAKVAKAKL